MFIGDNMYDDSCTCRGWGIAARRPETLGPMSFSESLNS